MAEYIDSGTDIADQTLGHWLESNVQSGIKEFWCQFGYFRFAAIHTYARILQDLAKRGCPVHIVLGSNSGSLVAADAQRVLRVVSGSNATLTIVAFSNAEFHPKTAYVTREDDSVAATVGSSNLTGRGLGQNVEAGVVFDSRTGDSEELFSRIKGSIDNWREIAQTVEGNIAGKAVFSITCDDDLRMLADHGIINVRKPETAPTPNSQGTTNGVGSLKRRRRIWHSPRQGWSPEIPNLIPLPSSEENEQQGSADQTDSSTDVHENAEDVLLMRIRPRRNGKQVQMSLPIHKEQFMDRAETIVDSGGRERRIAPNSSTRSGGNDNTLRFEAPELAGMQRPVALFRWVSFEDSDRILQCEIFDAEDSEEGKDIWNSLLQGITRPPVLARHITQLSHNQTVLSVSDQNTSQWYQLARIHDLASFK